MTVIAALPLTHLFTALLRDGTQIRQHPEDRPTVPRDDGTGSSYSDVLARLEEVAVFFLESGESETDPHKHLYAVHLDDGHFEIDGAAFVINPDAADVRAPRRLVYYRRVAHSRDSISGQLVQTTRSYHLGWEAGAVRHVIAVGHEVFKYG